MSFLPRKQGCLHSAAEVRRMSRVSFTLWGKRPSCKGRVTRDFVRQGNLCNSITEGPEMGRGIMTGYRLFCWTENRLRKPLSALQTVKGVVTVVNPVTNETLQNRNHPFLAVLEEKKRVLSNTLSSDPQKLFNGPLSRDYIYEDDRKRR